MTDAYAGSPLQSAAGSVGEEPCGFSERDEATTLEIAERVEAWYDGEGHEADDACQFAADIGTLLSLIDRLRASRSPSPLVSVPATDTQRLDWLVEKGAEVDESNSAAEDGTPWVCRYRTFRKSFQGEVNYFYGATAREAIDDAMEADNGK